MDQRITKVLELSGFEPSLVEELQKLGRMKKVKAGNYLVGPKSGIEEVPMVISGLLKVMRQDEKGNEILLYYLEGGDVCAMSIACCLGISQSIHSVLAEEDSEVWMIPVANMDRWVQKYRSFRKFVFESYQKRFEELLRTLDSIAFMRMDERLYKYLLDSKQAMGSYVIRKTHHQIAMELNTSRVVISRLLKQLEHEGKIEQHRNRIEIL